MIPERIVDFLKGPVIINFSSRNIDLRPTFSRTVGLIVSDDRKNITFYVHESFSKDLLKNLNENGRIALLAGTHPSHETYQFKGSFVSSRDTNDNDIEVQENFRKLVVAHFSQFGVPENFFINMPSSPGLAITFEVQDIFDQTPGPGAGKKIT